MSATFAVAVAGTATAVDVASRRLAMPPGTAAEHCVEGALMARTFERATQIYEQYFGVGEYEGKPVDGGFAKLEAAGTSWRSTYNNSQMQHFSKLKRIVGAIENKIENGQNLESVLAEFDALWTTEEVNMNPTKMISKLQQLGIVKQARRKKKAQQDRAQIQRRRQHQAASAFAPLQPAALQILPRNTSVI